jgi:cytochrome P450
VNAVSNFPFPDEDLGRVPRQCTWHQAQDPLGAVRVPSGDTVRLAVRYADVEAVLTDPRFSRDLSVPGAPRLQPGADMSDDRDTLINMDPPRHSRVRRLVSGAFTTRSVERWRPRIRAVAEELATTMRATAQPADLVAAVAEPLPIRVIAEILGVADGDLARFRHWSAVAMTIGPDPDGERARGREDFFVYLRELIAEHRRAPGNDLLDAMIAATDGGDRLTAQELLDITRSLLLAGYETTMTTIGRGAFTLLRHPTQYTELVADPELIPAAVDEILRYDFPADVGFLRLAKEDLELPSGTIRRGEGVMPLISAAHKDPERFADPDVFDIHRTDNTHLAFGKGPHYCIGGHLARVQLQEAFGALTRTFPKLWLAVADHEVDWKPSMMTHGIEALPVGWSA